MFFLRKKRDLTSDKILIYDYFVLIWHESNARIEQLGMWLVSVDFTGLIVYGGVWLVAVAMSKGKTHKIKTLNFDDVVQLKTA